MALLILINLMILVAVVLLLYLVVEELARQAAERTQQLVAEHEIQRIKRRALHAMYLAGASSGYDER